MSHEMRAQLTFTLPASLADDSSETSAVVKHVVDRVHDVEMQVSAVCCIDATAPLDGAERLQEGHIKLVALGKSYVFEETRIAFPIRQVIDIADDGTVGPFFPEYGPLGSEDLDGGVPRCRTVLLGRAGAFMENIPIFSSSWSEIVLPWKQGLGIDTPEEWERAELMFAALEAEKAV